MGNRSRHVVFETAWGFFGLCAVDDCASYSSLPVADRAAAAELITVHRPDSRPDPALLYDLQQRVKAYFEGFYIDFSDVPVHLPSVSAFARHVLSACHEIPYGRTASYAELARIAGSPQAARAVGSVMAGNPLPLIIPCHRIIRSDGRFGCFSATGGPELKARLLALEAQGVHAAAR